jgi:hypothetical protein
MSVLGRFTESDMSDKVTVPLHWTKQWGPDEEGGVSYGAGAYGFGSYSVQRYSKDESWEWRYCFDEYYDEATEKCSSLADGKRKAQAEWDARIQEIVASARPLAPTA